MRFWVVGKIGILFVLDLKKPIKHQLDNYVHVLLLHKLLYGSFTSYFFMYRIELLNIIETEEKKSLVIDK